MTADPSTLGVDLIDLLTIDALPGIDPQRADPRKLPKNRQRANKFGEIGLLPGKAGAPGTRLRLIGPISYTVD
jgi:hypothetical protein